MSAETTDATEEWRTVDGYGNYYEASNFGRIRSKDRSVRKYSALCMSVVEQHYKGKELKPSKDREGYFRVHVGVDGKKHSVQVGRMVLMAFVGKPDVCHECCHCNGDPSDNRIQNLRWDTHTNNNRDRIRHGTYKNGTLHHFSKYNDDIIAGITDGKISKSEALAIGVSNTHFYRIRGRRSQQVSS